MSVNEERRHRVYEHLKAAHGVEVAGAIMEMLPPAGVPELATKADMAVLKTDIDALRSEMTGFREEFGARFEALEARLGERIEHGLREQGNRFIGWMLGTAGVGIAAAGAFSRIG